MINASANTKTYRLVGYFPSWAIHARNYHVADIPADLLTHILYAFANVSASGECVSTNVADDQVNFPQLLQLKQQHPRVMTLISVGGAVNSPNFSAATGTDAARQKLTKSCVAFMKQNGFDGIDIDWEYPTAQEKQNFTALLVELRHQLDAQGGADKRPYLLTIAAPAGPGNFANIDLGQIHPHLDWINLMAYDFALPSRKVTDFCAPLKSYDPAIGTHAAENVDAAVQAYLKAGVPADKIVVGTHFAGIGWQGVPNNNNGLYQSNTGPAKGTWDTAGTPQSGSFDYKDIKANYLATYPRFWHADAQVPWLYSPSTGIMISYEDPESLGLKATYVVTNQLGGVMIWQLSADDAQHSLVSAIAGKLTAPTTFIHLGGANLGGTVLDNLKPGSPAQGFISDRLNSALKAGLAGAATKAGASVLADLLQSMPAADIAAKKDVNVHDFVSEEVTLPTDPAAKAAAEAAIAKLSTKTTVGELLGLTVALKDNPLFANEVKKMDVATLLQTSTALAANPQLIDSFINRYAGFKGSTADFWNTLSNDDQFKAAVPELQLTLQLGTLTLNNPQFVSALRARSPQIKSPRDLTSLSSVDWQQLITSQNIPVPDSISGATPAEKVTNYVHVITGLLHGAFPGDYFVQGLKQAVSQSKDPLDHGVGTFLNNAAGFDIINTNIAAYVKENNQAVFKGIDQNEQAAVTHKVAAWQRVSRVTSDFAKANALVTGGFTSAYRIASTPRATFIQQFSGTLGGAAQAEAIYAQAQGVAAGKMSLFSNVRHGLGGPSTHVIGDLGKQLVNYLNSPSSGIPDWQTLFGSLSYCSCTDCRSVYSAAAYFVDLLQFLKNSGKNGAGHSPLDVLLTRRPDLPYIKLNCENTDIPLPYVDLVNEILEGFVVFSNGKLDKSVAHDTSKDATADELSVNPEYTTDDAYNNHLSTAIFPLTLPFDRWLETSRTYLEFLGSSIYDVMRTFQKGADPSNIHAGAPSGIALACEYLKISQAECVILTGKNFAGRFPGIVPPPPL